MEPMSNHDLRLKKNDDHSRKLISRNHLFELRQLQHYSIVIKIFRNGKIEEILLKIKNIVKKKSEI